MITEMNICKPDRSKFYWDICVEDMETGKEVGGRMMFNDVLEALKDYAKHICKNKVLFEQNMCDITNEISKEAN